VTLADRTIARLRAEHDTLTGVIAGLTGEQLAAQSGAADWSVAAVLSHLGSGAEIAAAGYRAAFQGVGDGPGDAFNRGVWDVWNAKTPAAQAADFPGSDETCVAILESLDAGQRESLRLKLGFLPVPLTVAGAGGMRLHEAAQHGWDVRVAFDPKAGLDEETAGVLLEHFWGELAMLPKMVGKPVAGAEPVVMAIGDTGAGLVLSDGVEVVETVSEPTARFDGPVEAFVRLVGGRLGPAYVPDGLSVSGNIDLTTLQRVFPGF
jgi:uncharacterized protein (TIGR03083 family)